jgi:hypothetical protein
MGGGSSHQRRKFERALERLVTQHPEQLPPQTRSQRVAVSTQQNSLNAGDSIGLAALLLTVFAMVLTPPLWVKVPFILLSSVGCFIFFNKSHWTHLWKTAYRNGGASLLIVLVALVAVPQFETQWKMEHPATTASRRPNPPGDARVTNDPLEGEAFLTYGALNDFLAGRKATAPPIPKEVTWEQDAAVVSNYEQETLRIYEDIYEPRVKQIREAFALRGRTSAQLDLIYEAPQSSAVIRMVANSLRDLAVPGKY